MTEQSKFVGMCCIVGFAATLMVGCNSDSNPKASEASKAGGTQQTAGRVPESVPPQYREAAQRGMAEGAARAKEYEAAAKAAKSQAK